MTPLVQLRGLEKRFGRRRALAGIDLTITARELFGLVGPQLQAMGHTVKSINGDTVGGYQAIMFTPDATAAGQAGAGPIKGFYRAGSDHRKDGAAVGY